jgi:TonB-linked SusC/RagA family outer membrane protein
MKARFSIPKPPGIVVAMLCLINSPAFTQEALAYNPVATNVSQRNGTPLNNLSLGDLLNNIERRHDVSFVCRSEVLDIKVNAGKDDFSGNRFAYRLEKLLKSYNLLLKQISDKQYAISFRDESKKSVTVVAASELPSSEGAVAAKAVGPDLTNTSLTRRERKLEAIRQQQISGIVTARNSLPLAGVSVAVKGTDIGTTTDNDGKYSLNVPDMKGTLVFSYVDYKTREEPISERISIDVVLEEANKALEEVVIVGYGTQKKANLTGAVATLDGATLESRPVTAVSSAIQGLIPGLTSIAASPRPGATGANMRIRGISTLGNSELLLVIDGVPMANPGDLNIINPGDIETITVLKDAASASIYGARAANGVMLVTTKKGKADAKPSVAYNYYYGIEQPTAKVEFLSSVDYMQLLNESQRNVGKTPTYTDEQIQKAVSGSDPNYFANTDWIDAIYKPSGTLQNHNISVNGGNAKSGYFLSYGYLKDDGFVTGDAYKANRHNVRLRLNTEIADRVQLDGNISFINRFDSEPAGGTARDGGVIYSAHQISPLVPVRFTSGGWGYGGGSQNPLATATNGGLNGYQAQQVSGNINATIRIFEGLSVKGQYGVILNNGLRTIQNNTIRYYYPENNLLWYTNNPVNSVRTMDEKFSNQNVFVQADYGKKIAKHDFKLLAGYSQEWLRNDAFEATRQGIISEDLPVLNIGSGIQTNAGSAYHRAIRSVFGRFNYAFASKYLLEVNYRVDATSRFAEQNRWKGFPSFSAGWLLSEEKFMDWSRDVLSSAKIRGSYGKLGNENLGGNYYPYLSLISSVGTMPIGNVLTNAYAQTVAANPDLFWETHEMSNVGLDLTFLKNKLEINADYFVKNTRDILAAIPLPDVLGVSEPQQNLISVQNKGWELAINWKDNIGKLDYSFRFNVSDVNNKITDLASVAPVIGDQVRMVGEPIDAFYGLVADRISQVDDYTFNAATNKYTPKFPVLLADANFLAPGDIIYKDLGGPDGKPDGVITLDNDRRVIGNPYPRYTYGFRGTANYKGFDFAFFLQGVLKSNGYILGPARHAFINESTNPQKVHLDRWTTDNTDASYPRLTYQQSHNQRFSSFWLENGAYLRMKNLQFGYTLPVSLTTKLRISRLRFYASADNLFTVTKFFYAFDPETPLTNGGLYPQLKVFTFGINVNFR